MNAVTTCMYCGRPTRGSNHRYCTRCLSEGFSDLHRATGKTNGWDKKAKPKVYVESGWRGSPCIGGNIRTTSLTPINTKEESPRSKKYDNK